MKRTVYTVVTIIVLFGVAAVRRTTADERRRNQLTFSNRAGVQQTITTADSFDEDNPFFQSLGTNGRSCFSCHRPDQGWSVTPREIRERFEETRGRDPIFRNNDGSNCEGEDISTPGKRRKAFSMLMTKGLIRVGLPVPTGSEFTITDVEDPYYCGAALSEASMFRRPLPTTNLGFLSTVMWDGRRPSRVRRSARIRRGHRRHHRPRAGAPPSSDRRGDCHFRLGLFTAQTYDHGAGAEGGRCPRRSRGRSRCAVLHRHQRSAEDAAGDASACAGPSSGLAERVTIFGRGTQPRAGSARAIARGEALFDLGRSSSTTRQRTPPPPISPAVQRHRRHDTPNSGNHSVSSRTSARSAARRTPVYRYAREEQPQETVTRRTRACDGDGKWGDMGSSRDRSSAGSQRAYRISHNGSAAAGRGGRLLQHGSTSA
jgi:hypothetical protein